MGLQNQLNDVSSDSIPLLFIALIAKSIDHLRCLIFTLFNSIGITRFEPSHRQSIVALNDSLLSSGLTNLILLSEQLKINKMFAYRYYCNKDVKNDRNDYDGDNNCVVCLYSLRDGDQVRKLDCCRHVFHKHCFDSWLDHLNFNCPLCRNPLISDQRVVYTRSCVAGDLVNWFATVR